MYKDEHILYEVKCSDSVANGAQDGVAVAGEDDISLLIYGTAKVQKLSYVSVLVSR